MPQGLCTSCSLCLNVLLPDANTVPSPNFSAYDIGPPPSPHIHLLCLLHFVRELEGTVGFCHRTMSTEEVLVLALPSLSPVPVALVD